MFTFIAIKKVHENEIPYCDTFEITFIVTREHDLSTNCPKNPQREANL